AGLQPGDAIDRTHLLEIIAAVDYLITKGCWRTATIHSARMSPMTAFGRTCGYFEDHLGPIEPSCNNQCCASCDPPYAMPADCTPYSAPSWEDCTRFERCDMWRSRSYRCTEPSSVTFAHDVECDVTVGNNSTNYACSHLPGGSGPIDCNIFEQVFGWAAFLCGPRRSDNGPGEGTYPSGNPLWSDHDDDHGNGLRKLRRGDWPPGDILNAGIRSYGNSYEKVTHCRNDTDNPGHPDVGFEEVTPVKWEGLTPGWIGEATCTPGNFITGIPWSPVPGLGEFLPDGETPICTAHDNAEPFPERVTGGSCAVGNNVGDYCMGNNCYVQIDLNLHGGVPRLKDYVMGIRLLTDGGGPISPAVWEWSDYPCATAPDLTDKPCGS
ncbi:MAG: hypothetical protein GY842_24490, partial [bacterium]|nr:hypothetical protein [bacterium]